MASALHEAWLSSDAGKVHRRCEAMVNVGTMYEALHQGGLQYGPAFRAVEWGRLDDGTCAETVAGLKRRVHWQGVRVHPADLDGALQFTSAPAVAARGTAGAGAAGEIRLPFAIDDSLLRGAAARRLWTVRRRNDHLPLARVP